MLGSVENFNIRIEAQHIEIMQCIQTTQRQKDQFDRAHEFFQSKKGVKQKDETAQSDHLERLK